MEQERDNEGGTHDEEINMKEEEEKNQLHIKTLAPI